MCHDVNGEAKCTCYNGYYGFPPNCHPECTQNYDCATHLACNNFKCIDPCPGSCGHNALCHVINHVAQCTCMVNYIGNPFISCHLRK